MEAATALILERQGDSTVLHKHLAHFYGYKPPVKVLASQCAYYGSSLEGIVLNPGGGTMSPSGFTLSPLG